MKVTVIIKKSDLDKFIDKFGIEEYHYKNHEITVDMTKLFDSAAADLPAKTESVEQTSSSDVF
jgi:hypothetical protein